jgi:glutathione synthase/RimK-type ligase-like ATP-grasp enzyme
MKMESMAADRPADEEGASPIGVAKLSKMQFDGGDLRPLWRELISKYIHEPLNAAALMDLAVVEQLFGDRESGCARQAEALKLRRIYRSSFGPDPASLRLLAFAVPGDIGANTPLEFLLEGSDVELFTLYVVPGAPLPEAVPDHDIAFLAIGEADEHRLALDRVGRLVAAWPRPVLNRPDRIALLSRERLHAVLASAPGLLIPVTTRLERARLEQLRRGEVEPRALLPDAAFPLILRPVGSHAGHGLQKLDDRAALAGYLKERPEPFFYASPFIDYRSSDGLFRKYRIVFIEGRPYGCHMAITDQWMIYYLNANMKESALKRAEEERFMTRFDVDFARRHGAALAAIAEHVGLDYFGIDCAETAGGRLLIFEADIAMIVHAMDDPRIFPYKVPQMRKIFDAFTAMLRARSGKARR